jgi:glycosyltransferase involved in cell wall biosynthesis
MVSVCMATKNGAAYIREQLDSILMQLDAGDELIISDDASTDETMAIVQSYTDSRIKLIQNLKPKGVTRNFEASLMASAGNYIFLSDQDDVWVPLKIKTMLHHLQQYDLVVSDCLVVDHTLKTKSTSFFTANKSGKGLLRNILKNSYMGCCMAFNRKLLMRALPFPHDIPIHDFWIGLIGEVHFNVKFLPEMLVYHRRHFSNTSSTGENSPLSFQQKLAGRYHIIKNLFLHRSYAE